MSESTTSTSRTEPETDNQLIFKAEFDFLPDEVTAYAFDQFDDRLAEYLRGDYPSPIITPDEMTELNYENQTVGIRETVVTGLLVDAAQEKLRDMKQEVRTNNRGDFTFSELTQYERNLHKWF